MCYSNSLTLPGNHWHFFSMRLQPAEVKYSFFGRELLATYLPVKHFRHFLEGRSFAILTDHRALVSAVDSQSNNYSPREIRHSTSITEFTTDVQHVAGTTNVVADALSRGSIDSVALPPVVDFTALAQAQQVDSELELLLSKDRSTSLMLELVPWTGTEIQLYCDMSSGKARPFVPTSFHEEVFQSIHNLAHTGVRATRKLLADRFVWTGIRTDVATWVRQCEPCQRSKVQRHTKSPIGTFRSPSVRFANIHLDLVGPLPPSSGMTCLLTIDDRYTRWPEAIPLPNLQAALLLRLLFLIGLPGLVCQNLSLQIAVDSLRLHCLLHSPTCSGVVISEPLPITLRRTVWWSDFISN